MLWDNHMHTHFSSDSKANPVQMIEAAKSKSLDGITFTDHLDLDYWPEPEAFQLDVPLYFKEQKQIAREHTSENFTVLTGIEIGLQDHLSQTNKEIMSSLPFDVVIGSIHQVDKMDPYYDSYWEGRSAKECYRRYYESTLENIELCPFFNTLGHVDYIFRYHRQSDDVDTYTEYRDIVDAILEALIKRDIALEINTGGFKSGLTNPNPNRLIIKRYKELGGEMITLGADAHMPEHVAFAFDKLPLLLNDCGFNEFVVFKDKKPVFYPL